MTSGNDVLETVTHVTRTFWNPDGWDSNAESGQDWSPAWGSSDSGNSGVRPNGSSPGSSGGWQGAGGGGANGWGGGNGTWNGAGNWKMGATGWGNRDPLIASTVVQTIVSFFTVIGNVVVLFAILRPKNSNKLRTPTNLLLANVAVIDGIRGLLTTPFTLALFWVSIHDKAACVFMVSAVLAMGKMTTMAYVIVTLERFVAIRYPFHHQRLASHRHIAIILLCLWIFGCAYGLFPAVLGVKNNWKPRIGCVFAVVISLEYLVYFSVLGTYLLEYVIMVGVYTYIIMVARRHRRQLAVLSIVAPTVLSVDASQGVNTDMDSGGNPIKTTAPKIREVNRSLRCLFLLVVHFFCNWPICVYDCLMLWAHIEHINTLIICLVVLKNINSCLNPVLYMMTNKTLRDEVFALVPAFCRRRKTNQVTPFVPTASPPANR